MMRFFLLLATTLLLNQVVRAAEPANPPMAKFVVRLFGANVDPDSFAAKPRTLYRAGETYARLEHAPDPARDMHKLVVIAEPDIWDVNLIAGTGQHSVDPGPRFVVHINIMPPGGPKEFATLEFGAELEFFKLHKATSAPERVLDGKRCHALKYSYGDYRLLLYSAVDSGLPFQLEVYRNDHLNVALRYLTYERNLPFEPELFKPPADIKMTEAPAK